jgi:hypothetical protein
MLIMDNVEYQEREITDDTARECAVNTRKGTS